MTNPELLVLETKEFKFDVSNYESKYVCNQVAAPIVFTPHTL